MTLKILRTAGPALLIGAALTLSATAALAQSATTAPLTPNSNADVQNAASNQSVPSDEVTVRAAREARHQDLGKDYAGIPIEQLTLSREVGYGDIDIHSPRGVVVLRRRIMITAQNACMQLSNLYPVGAWTSTAQECVSTAFTSALSQLPANVAAAVDNRTPLR